MVKFITYNPAEHNNEPYVINAVKHRLVEQRKNWICGLVGPPGTGKTYSAISLAKTIDPTFDISRVCLDPLSFFQKIKERLPEGSGLILDEAGINASSKLWQSVNNRMLNFILQAFRKRRIFVIFTMPGIDNFDSSSRKLLNTIIEVQKVDFKSNLCEAKWLDYSYNPRYGGKAYNYFPRYIHPITGLTAITKVYFRLADKKMLEQYEEMKEAFLERLEKDSVDAIYEALTQKKMRSRKVKSDFDKQTAEFGALEK